MASAVQHVDGKGTFPRGVHPPQRKQFASEAAIEALPAPAQVQVPLLQHTGAPCEPAVKPRQKVSMGDVLGSSDAFVSAPVHSPIAGAAARPCAVTLPNGRRVQAVPVKADGDQLEGDALWQDVLGGDWPEGEPDTADTAGMLGAIREAGLVGLGGAAFPTAVKLTPNEQKPIDVLLVNGCECEPYLTADYRLMLEAPRPIVLGARIAARIVGAADAVIVIEDNKPAAVQSVREAVTGAGIRVMPVRTKYPMGGERQLIPAALGREVPTGGLPLDVGVVVINVGTAAAIARAVLRGRPLTHRVVSVTGAGIARPANLLVPIGTSYRDLIDHCGGLKEDAARVVAGGPMMGFAVGDLDAPVTKGTSGLTVLTRDDVRRMRETACIRCGRCVDACPLHLVPTKIAEAVRHADRALGERYHTMACCECGCCAYVCPAGLPLVQLIRTGKARLMRN